MTLPVTHQNEDCKIIRLMKKGSGHDGINTEFFKSCWPKIEAHLAKTFRDCSQQRVSPRHLKDAMVIALH